MEKNYSQIRNIQC